MASFTAVDDTVSLSMKDRGDEVAIALSGTYSMQIDLEREVGAPGSGAWEKVKTVSTTANATIADTYYTKSYNETLRLRVIVDTSGTCTATLTDNPVSLFNIVDNVGTVLVEQTQDVRTFKTDVDFDESVYGPPPVNETAATLTLTQNAHAGRCITLNRAAGVTVTLPAASGSGDRYTILTLTAVTSNDNIIQVASASDVMQGAAWVSQDAADTVVAFEAAATSDTMTMNGTTTGGLRGDRIDLIDVASGVWSVQAFLAATGTEATPFSAAV